MVFQIDCCPNCHRGTILVSCITYHYIYIAYRPMNRFIIFLDEMHSMNIKETIYLILKHGYTNFHFIKRSIFRNHHLT